MSRRLPLALIALLLLGLVVQPMLGAACGDHDAAHLLATGHGHDAPGHADGSTDEGPTDPWVDVVHLGQCCAHGGSIAVASAAWQISVVVDTPPTRNALDFIDASRRLTSFLDHRLYKMLMTPTKAYMKAMNVAAQALVRTISKVVGGEVLDDALTFFNAFEGMEEGFRQRAERVNELLAAPETAFVLVASPRRDTVDEAHYFADRLQEAGIAVQGLIVNRVHPSFGMPSAGPVTAAVAAGTAKRAETLAGTDIGGLYRNLADFQAVSSREQAHLSGLAEAVAPAAVAWVPFLRSDVHDIAGMDEVAQHVFSRVTTD